MKTVEEIKTRIGEILGEVSMRWGETLKGVFQSNKATELLDEVLVLMEEYRSQHSELPSDEEIETYVSEQPIHEMSIEYSRNLITKGAKYMRSIVSPIINELKSQINLANIYIEDLKDELHSKDARIKELEEVVQSLADWSKKYPKGKIYPMSKITMEDELSEIENKAKALTPPKP